MSTCETLGLACFAQRIIPVQGGGECLVGTHFRPFYALPSFLRTSNTKRVSQCESLLGCSVISSIWSPHTCCRYSTTLAIRTLTFLGTPFDLATRISDSLFSDVKRRLSVVSKDLQSLLEEGLDVRVGASALALDERGGRVTRARQAHQP